MFLTICFSLFPEHFPLHRADKQPGEQATNSEMGKDASSKDAASKDASSKDAASKDASSKDASSRGASSKDAAGLVLAKKTQRGIEVAPEGKRKVEEQDEQQSGMEVAPEGKKKVEQDEQRKVGEVPVAEHSSIYRSKFFRAIAFRIGSFLVVMGAISGLCHLSVEPRGSTRGPENEIENHNHVKKRNNFELLEGTPYKIKISSCPVPDDLHQHHRKENDRENFDQKSSCSPTTFSDENMKKNIRETAAQRLAGRKLFPEGPPALIMPMLRWLREGVHLYEWIVDQLFPMANEDDVRNLLLETHANYMKTGTEIKRTTSE